MEHSFRNILFAVWIGALAPVLPGQLVPKATPAQPHVQVRVATGIDPALAPRVLATGVLDDSLLVVVFCGFRNHYVRVVDLLARELPGNDEAPVRLYGEPERPFVVPERVEISGSFRDGTAAITFHGKAGPLIAYAHLADGEADPWVQVGPADPRLVGNDTAFAQARLRIEPDALLDCPGGIAPDGPPSRIVVATPGRWVAEINRQGASRLYYQSDPAHALSVEVAGVEIEEVYRRLSTGHVSRQVPPMRVSWAQHQCGMGQMVNPQACQQVIGEMATKTERPHVIGLLKARPAYPAVPSAPGRPASAPAGQAR